MSRRRFLLLTIFVSSGSSEPTDLLLSILIKWIVGAELIRVCFGANCLPIGEQLQNCRTQERREGFVRYKRKLNESEAALQLQHQRLILALLCLQYNSHVCANFLEKKKHKRNQIVRKKNLHLSPRGSFICSLQYAIRSRTHCDHHCRSRIGS